MVTFFTGDETAALDRVDLLGSGPGWVVTAFDGTLRSPSRDVLAAIGPRATTRTFGTITRLTRALGIDTGQDPTDRPTPPREPPMPDDLADALAREGLLDTFSGLPRGRRRTLLTWVETAERDQTRRRRIEGVITRLQGR